MATRTKSSSTSKKVRQTLSEVVNSSSNANSIEPATGKLGIMIVGMGAVATTFVAGVEAIRKGLAQPIGSLTQMGLRPRSTSSFRWLG
jgi:Myo-inositol-1-phosphate synthase